MLVVSERSVTYQIATPEKNIMVASVTMKAGMSGGRCRRH